MDEKNQALHEWVRAQDERARAMGPEEMEARAQAQVVGMMQAPGPTDGQQAAMSNYWREQMDLTPDEPPLWYAPTRVQRFRAWLARPRWW